MGPGWASRLSHLDLGLSVITVPSALADVIEALGWSVVTVEHQSGWMIVRNEHRSQPKAIQAGERAITLRYATEEELAWSEAT